MEPVNNNRVDRQQGQRQHYPLVVRDSAGAIGRAQTAIFHGLTDAVEFFSHAPDLVISKTLSFLKKRGNEHFGEIAASSKRSKNIADSLVLRLNVPQHGIPTLLAKINAGAYKDLETLTLPSTISDQELTHILETADRSGLEITELNLFGCVRLTHLPNNLPPGLIALNMSNCHRIEQITDNLPASLKHLDASECYEITAVPLLPESLETLKLNFCDQIRSITEPLPESIQILELIECSSLEELPPHLPSGLVELNLARCIQLQELPEELPAKLRSLNIQRCDSLEELTQNLPEELSVIR